MEVNYGEVQVFFTSIDGIIALNIGDGGSGSRKGRFEIVNDSRYSLFYVYQYGGS
ncbi:hypothetical protein PA598K_07140 [Paenibacillus sp. 598K]|nr:hypothetical protein PA598K_07140 [Paenibacillus sp. 598K]